MARARATEPSDSENEVVSSPKTKSANGSKQAMAPAEQVEEVGEGSEEGSGEEEYEIESIIDSKRGGYGPGFAYLVSWKGYSADHNSWVDDKDAGNATDLIAEYWKKNSKDKKGRKSIDKPKGGRKSAVRDTSAEATSAVKKRGRAKAKKEDTDAEGESEGGGPRTMKRARKSTGDTKMAKMSAASMDVDEVNEDEVGMMEKYMDLESWEKLIKTIDTVEKGDDGQLYVYFTLKTDNERHKQRSDVCKQRFPLHLINFYEGHLRWKQMDETDAA